MAYPTLFSTEMAAIPPQSVAYTPLTPAQAHGRVRVATFNRACAAEAENVVIGLCNIPKNAKVLSVKFAKSATLGATVNFDIGLAGADSNGYIDDTSGATVADAVAHFGNVANTTAASVATKADTIAENMCYVLKKNCVLTLKVKGAAISAAGNISGYVLYVVD